MTKKQPAQQPAPDLDVALSELVPDPQNRRKHGARNIGMIADALRSVGAARSIVVDEDNVVLSGNGVTVAAEMAGIRKVRVIETDGDELIAVRRRGLTPEQKRALAIYDNRTGELSEWDFDQLETDKAAGLTLQPFWTEDEETAMASKASADEIDAMARQATPQPDENEAPVSGADPHTFFCALTIDQERIVRAALRAARALYRVETAGDALTAALQAWADNHQPSEADNGTHV
jgi:hypothetical protein